MVTGSVGEIFNIVRIDLISKDSHFYKGNFKLFCFQVA